MIKLYFIFLATLLLVTYLPAKSLNDISDSKLIVNGYKGIPFGITKEGVKKYLNDSLGLKQSTDPYSVAEDEYGDREDNIFFFIKLDEEYINVELYFTSNNLFYYQKYSMDKLTANYFDSELKSNVLFLSSIFQKKYGKPNEKHNPSFSSIQEGSLSYFWNWKIPGFEIFTAF